ncbi:TPA: LysR family transcriptional regulator [Pseudomonas aeruginosa]|uniref:LysR family transcriptional regulator n=1 Tax=Pseudoxanthomonas spadix (strain BD-a59) TaxID=1045855 RepID=G7UNP6_PSEUP|nr:LysR family transcriptional regulator [Pseudoxanthomonas spadix]AER56670.1 LysR family transcriptional regulator [Pseudoxanthomonas spadix BD-a59]HBN9808226.1 LysR family transcriptional regulator [Pseudomonas aeruginosa]HBN9814731.1 LysR family transcriptional regulator [Pseudomonas aeruginosa]
MNGTEFEQITAFLAAIEHGGFNSAGQALGRDGSILSRRVTALERRLGVRLMERTTRRLALTEAGEAFHQRMRGALQALQEIEQDTAAAATGVRGTLRIALPATFGRMWVAPILPAFLATYPDLLVEAAFEDRYVDLVAESFDVAVRIGTLADSRLVARRLAPSRRLLCASPAYLQAHGTPVRPADLAQHACLGFSRLASHPLWHLHDGDKATAIRIAGPLVTDDAQSLVQAAVSGAGIAMVSDWLAGPELCSGRLVPVLPDHPVENNETVYLVHPSARLVPAKTRAFTDWIVGELGTRPWLSQASAD